MIKTEDSVDGKRILLICDKCEQKEIIEQGKLDNKKDNDDWNKRIEQNLKIYMEDETEIDKVIKTKKDRDRRKADANKLKKLAKIDYNNGDYICEHCIVADKIGNEIL